MENLTVKIDDHPIVEIQTITIGPGSIGARIDQLNGMAVNRQAILTPYRHPKMTPIGALGSWPDAV